MERRLVLALVLFLCAAITEVHCQYHSDGLPHTAMKEKKTNLHFFFHDTISGSKPSSVMVAHANLTQGDKTRSPSFGSLFVIDNPLTEGPELTSKVIGNARGLSVSSSQEKVMGLMLYVDYGFTTGEFNGSSISVFSRNPVTEPQRELAVVGGRGKFRMARGFAKLKTHSWNVTSNNGIVEYKGSQSHDGPYDVWQCNIILAAHSRTSQTGLKYIYNCGLWIDNS
ncbi:hypothetical protein F0562_020467 [Nyssa sinensis]|uniref:Dirigent protein n=1 Tax=Nyssa sinensis TaxID=561372 RepID=A0A5J5BWW2_9ASTE|nr:hypothetical protein F0562_020467 [Nyssa sinensis]